MRKFCLGFILLLFNAATTQAKDNFAEMTLDDPKRRVLQSKIVPQQYQLMIKLPTGYEQSNKNLLLYWQ